MYNNRRLMRH